MEQTFEKAVAELPPDEDGSAAPAAADGWVTIAIVLPDGTCRDDRLDAEDNGNQIVTVEIRERADPDKPPGNPVVRVVIRGITGHVRVEPATAVNTTTPQGQRP